MQRRVTDTDAFVREMRETVPRIVRELAHHGIAVTEDQVYMHYPRAESWLHGRLALGYLMRTTGWRPKKGRQVTTAVREAEKIADRIYG